MGARRGPDKPRRPAGRPPSADDLARIGEAVLASLPKTFRRHLGEVTVRVQDFADEATLKDLEIESPYDLTGLYHGVPIGLREGQALPHGGGTDMIHLYRLPILAEWCEDDRDLTTLVRHVLIHEIGHHFGLSDEAMARIEAAAEGDDA